MRVKRAHYTDGTERAAFRVPFALTREHIVVLFTRHAVLYGIGPADPDEADPAALVRQLLWHEGRLALDFSAADLAAEEPAAAAWAERQTARLWPAAVDDSRK